ncbi:MAG: Holliday junction branch migration protein RuvA [Lachnospiraceae bacterium]|nr:Holliday junction branch migration protein RuvA [Lachnospiraceae bacterium]
MYAYIKGELAEVYPDFIVIETGGIGYQVFITGQTFSYLPAVGEEIKVYTYLYLREDAMILYGFLTRDDLELFKLLLSVSGIGPKAGIAILSVLDADDLRFAVLSGDAKAIAKAPGIGNKTAQRVILELKDKLSLEDAFEKKTEHMQEKETAGSQVKNDAVLALTALGYSSTESLKAVSAVEISEDMDVESVLKAALKHLI